MATVLDKMFSVDEYLDLEKSREETGGRPAEFIDGTIREMRGADWRHNVLVGNLACVLGTRLKGKKFAVCGSQMRVRVSESGPYYYPDVTVIPIPPRIAQDRGQSLLDPLVIFEVTSPSTERIDRREKVANYSKNDSVKDYVIVSSGVIWIDHHSRKEDGSWDVVELQLEDALRLQSLGIELPLAEIYDRVLPENAP